MNTIYNRYKERIRMTKEIPPYVKVLQVLRENDPVFAESLARTIKEVDGALDNMSSN